MVKYIIEGYLSGVKYRIIKKMIIKLKRSKEMKIFDKIKRAISKKNEESL